MAAAPIIPQLTQNSLQDISNQRGLKFEKRRPDKSTMLEALNVEVETQGIKAFVQSLKVPELQELTSKMGKKKLTSNGANNANSRSVLSKRLVEAMTDKGVSEYLTSLKLSEKQLTTFITNMGIEVKESSKKELLQTLETEIHYMGLSTIFSNCTVKQLQVYAKDLGLEVESNAKTVLLRCILSMTNYTAADKPKINRKPREKKQPKEETEEDVKMDMDIPRGPPPKFEWYCSDDSESEDFEVEPSPEDEDCEMSDVGDEDEEEEEAPQEDSEDDEDDGGEYMEKKKSRKDDMDDDE